MKDVLKFYRIKNTATGLYSTGGVVPRWNKKGKVWNNIGHIKSHITGVKAYANPKKFSIKPPTQSMRTWEIEEAVFNKTSVKIIPIAEVILLMGSF